jgi:lactoylglutathione lyase
MQTGETTLAFAAKELATSNLQQGFQENSLENLPVGIEIGFVTENVAAAFKRAIEAGAIAVVEPKVKPWGQIVAYVRDRAACATRNRDGILISINTPIE